MGIFMSKTMDKVMGESMEKQKELMSDNQEVMLESQIVIQNEIRQRMMALQLSMARERFYWWLGFFSIASVGLTVGALKSKNPAAVFAPLVPISFVFGYQADLAVGNKMERILADTDNMLKNEPALLRLPGEQLTLDYMEKQREIMRRK